MGTEARIAELLEKMREMEGYDPSEIVTIEFVECGHTTRIDRWSAEEFEGPKPEYLFGFMLRCGRCDQRQGVRIVEKERPREDCWTDEDTGLTSRPETREVWGEEADRIDAALPW